VHGHDRRQLARGVIDPQLAKFLCLTVVPVV
jgi:hypothetical protein